ncbi:MAG: tRNA (uridine(34)/cytosine(34)/5-carboxymethylaminomethyluridine(34)-2'-O)-methyltransferase TrmL [Gammaproteobacteria bacterium]|nr:tRNA (uridine(34)/cytosine(34)/5-carboxymethylaminomethyluridine(34)-2'-O)-methyltransferase TrmL [Gammaproteobacteria bacterium]
MFNIVLYQPEIPPNTGNIIRLCANTGCHLHLIEPLGFDLDDKKLRRAGLDYHEWADVQSHASLEVLVPKLAETGSIYAISTRGRKNYSDISYSAGDSLVFGPETRGLPQNYLDSLAQGNILRLPMLENSRSLNLSNTAAIVVYEALRQTGFKGLG